MREPVRHHHKNARGERVRILGWTHPEARIALLIHHGLGEHIGRYQTWANQLEDTPVSIWGYDCRGHGESEGRRGQADGLPMLASDLEEMIPVLLEHAGTERALLWGHSMGGAVVGWYLTTRSPHPALASAGLSAPAVVVPLAGAQAIKASVGRVLSRFAPGLTLSTGLPPDQISSVAEEVQRYVDDPLVHDRISLELARSLIDEAQEIPRRAGSVALPVLLLHGDADEIAHPDGSKLLSKNLKDAELHLFPGLRHELHHEQPERVTQVFEVVKAWIGKHTPQK